jgi:hypothetical protein
MVFYFHFVGTFGCGSISVVARRGLRDFTEQHTNIQKCITIMRDYLNGNRFPKSSPQENVLHQVATTQCIHLGKPTVIATAFTKRMKETGGKLTKEMRAYVAKRIQYGGGDVTKLPIHASWHQEFGRSIIDLHLYICHILKSVDSSVVDCVLKNCIGVCDEMTHDFKRGTSEQARLLLNVTLHQVKSFNHMHLNGRDWRRIISLLILTDRPTQVPPLLSELPLPSTYISHTGQCLLEASSYLGWSFYHDDGGDLSDGHISQLIVTVMTLQIVGPIASTSLFSVKKDHWHQCLSHVVEQALSDYTPLKLFDEGLHEANLRMVEKNNWKHCAQRLKDEAHAAMKVAKIYGITQGTYMQVSKFPFISIHIRTIDNITSNNRFKYRFILIVVIITIINQLDDRFTV